MTDKTPLVSIIIPSSDGYRGGNVPKLIEEIKKQDCEDIEIIVVKGVSPGSRARNEGARKAKGKYLVFFDDDVTINKEDLISRLLRTLDGDPAIGMVGAAMQVPRDATSFQRRMVKECSYHYSPSINAATDSDLVCHACQAIPRELYQRLGGENEKLLRGEDADFHDRMRKAGYRIVLAAGTEVYHPPVKNIRDMIKWRFDAGFFGARDQVYFPHLIFEYGKGYGSEFKRQRNFLFRVVRFVFDRLLYSVVSFRFLRFVFYASYGMGRIAGIVIFGIQKYVFQKKA